VAASDGGVGSGVAGWQLASLAGSERRRCRFWRRWLAAGVAGWQRATAVWHAASLAGSERRQCRFQRRWLATGDGGVGSSVADAVSPKSLQ
jgi:hypothetical protein